MGGLTFYSLRKPNMIRIVQILVFLFPLYLIAQQPPATPATDRTKMIEQRKMAANKGADFSEISFKSVGPTVMSGRITDLAVDEKDPSHFFAAYASGGLWYTNNNGNSFTPIFDNEAVMTIGDVAVNWQDSIIWVGTGEVNSSRSSYAGLGMYVSYDWGKSWEHKGLTESHHTARIILHPTDKNTLWVAMLGHLYSPNEERGVFKTTDGGATWTKTLFVDNNSGAIDLLIDKDNPNLLFASTWTRERRAWNFVESGNGSGIYKSEDGGDNWTKISTEKSGFPTGEGVGRIGLSRYSDGSKTVMYAILDNYFRRPKDKKDKKTMALSKDELRSMSKDKFLKLSEDKVAAYLNDNGFPKKYDVGFVYKKIKAGKITPIDLVTYTEDANSLLFDTPVIGAEIYRSDDNGVTWKKTHDDYLDAVYNSYGYYFGQIRVSPNDPDRIYFMGVPVVTSKNGGKTFENINEENVHVDHHALWLNGNRDGHIILGNDGGVNISYDYGQNWFKCNTPAVGQFYAVAVDNAKPYNVYGGLQDNGVWTGPHTNETSSRWQNTGHNAFKELIGGDGMQVAVDTRDNNTVYTGFQFGWYFRINKASGDRKQIKPKHELGESPLRFNWQTPIHLSAHNQDILYLGANKLYRSFNQGDDWKAISDDLTKGGKKGDVAFGTITSIDESPFQFGKIYVGTDDGLIYRTDDGGSKWNKINAGLPEDMWVTRVWASRHEENRVYASLNGYRWDDFSAYVYVSEDNGNTWRSIHAGLPVEPVNVIKEDPVNPDLLYVGTDHGLYSSLDRGQSYMLMNNGLPAVAVHDVVVHPTANDLIVGTHGRSIYIADIAPLQAMHAKEPLIVFDIGNVRRPRNLGGKKNIWSPKETPNLPITFYTDTSGKVKLSIENKKGVVYSNFIPVKKGYNKYEFNYSIGPSGLEYLKAEDGTAYEAGDDGKYYLPSGSYTLKLVQANTEASTNFELK